LPDAAKREERHCEGPGCGRYATPGKKPPYARRKLGKKEKLGKMPSIKWGHGNVSSNYASDHAKGTWCGQSGTSPGICKIAAGKPCFPEGVCSSLGNWEGEFNGEERRGEERGSETGAEKEKALGTTSRGKRKQESRQSVRKYTWGEVTLIHSQDKWKNIGKRETD